MGLSQGVEVYRVRAYRVEYVLRFFSSILDRSFCTAPRRDYEAHYIGTERHENDSFDYLLFVVRMYSAYQ